MTKIGASFRNFRDRVRSSISVKAQNALFFTALFLIVMVAIMIRLTPVLRGPILIKAFDPWIQYYNAKYLSEHTLYEYFTWRDYKSWYPTGVGRGSLRPGLTFTVVTIYHILNFVGIPITLYEVCYYFPPFMGGLTVLAAYFLGKEILNRECGLFAAFFLAFNTGHMQRTMAGFFDNETIGVFATLMTLLFFLKAIRTGKITHSVLGGIFLGYLSLSWGGFTYVFFIIPLVCGLLILMNKYNENVLIAYVGVQGTGLLIYSLYVKFRPESLFSELDVGGIFFFTFILIAFHLLYTKKNEYPKLYSGILKSIVWIMIPGALIMGIIIWSSPDIIPFGIGKRLESVLSPLVRDELHIVASVAEHMPSAWSIYYYNTLIPLMLLPLGIFFCFKKLEAPEILLILFLLTLFYFTGSMIRIILLFAPAAALMGAYGLVSVLKIYGSFAGERKEGISRKRKRQLDRTVGNSEVFTVYFLVGFLCVAQVIHAANISIEQLSYSQLIPGGQFHDWEESLTWMKENLAGTDVVVSWWDYGYWLTPIGNVTTVNDNATSNSTTIGMTGMAFMQTNEIYSAKIFRRLKADYVLVYFGFLINGLGGDEGKWPWMLRICNDNYEKFKEWGMEEDNWKEDSVFKESEYINGSSGKYEDNWFDSQLVRLMFFNEPTDPSRVIDPNNQYLQWYYASQIGGNPSQGINPRKDDNGNTWASHIPPDGAYTFKVFKEEFASTNRMVKLFRVDYTALDSSFSVNDAKVYNNENNDYAVFNLKNTGTRDLTINNVEINGYSYGDFIMSENDDTKILNKEDETAVWVDIGATGQNFNIDDTVNISVSAQAEALEVDGEPTYYDFSNYTSNFFVEEAEEEQIKINRENSRVYLHSEDLEEFPDLILEVENIGDSIVKLDKFYVGTDVNTMNATTYNEGSSVLAPGEKAEIYFMSIPEEFYPFGIGYSIHPVGVVTARGTKDEVLFAANINSYKISILEEDRIVSPEVSVLVDYPLRHHIPVNLNKTHAVSYENGTTIFHVDVKNTGDTDLGFDQVYLVEPNPWTIIPNDKYEWDTIDEDLILDEGDENTILIKTLEPNLFDVNEEIIIYITTTGYDLLETGSDIGFIHTINEKPDIQLLDFVGSMPTSIIQANESGFLLIKNTGNESITLDKIIINETLELSFDTNITYLQGEEDPTLDIQEVVQVYFNITGFNINESNDIFVNVTTTSGLYVNKTYEAVVHTINHNIKIDDEDVITPAISIADEDMDLEIIVDNLGLKNVTIESVYINDTYVPLMNFSLGSGETFEIGELTGSVTLTISMGTTYLEQIIGITFDVGDKIKILVRTKEGAEDEVILEVV